MPHRSSPAVGALDRGHWLPHHHRAAARAHDSPASCRPLVARDSDEAAAHILSLVRAGDVLLIKGSRGLRMERILSALSASAHRAG